MQVKELESLVEKMVGSHAQDHNDNDEEYLAKDVNGSGRINGMMNSDDNGIRVSFANKHSSSNGQSNFDGTETSDSESERNYHDENDVSGNFSDERCLYEEPCGIVQDRIDCMKNKSYSTLHRNGEVAKEKRSSLREKSVESVTDSTSSTLDSEHCEKENSESNLYERCCDFVNNGCGKTCQSGERSQVYLTPDCTDAEVNRVGQCSKVYTHKKRKASGDRTSERHTHFEKSPPQPVTSNRIDLADESSDDQAPVTLNTNLDTESSDYLLSFNSESIQSIVGCSLSDFVPSTKFELLNARTHLTDDVNEKDSGAEAEAEGEDRPPVLRRSVRLNQQENEETFSPRSKSKLRDDKKSRSSSNMKLFSRTKRKNKELERRVPNVKVIVTTGAQSSRKSQTRPLRKTSKLAGRCNSNPKSHLPKNEKDAGKPKTTDKPTATNTVGLDKHLENNYTENSHHQHHESVKTNTTASVNRALWGDMSDVAEDGEIDEEFLEYSTSAEIPFAVGLLPLRAALERMQATLDHQPRKTRSSVASTKQDTNSLKRKASPSNQQEVPTSKRQNTNDSSVLDDNPSAVCHIQIRTSTQCSRPRKRSLSDGAASLGQTTAVNGRP